MTEVELNELIKNIANKKTLFGLSTNSTSRNLKNLAQDFSIYNEWQKYVWKRDESVRKNDPLDRFSKGLAEILSRNNKTQEYALALAKTIRANFDTGQFTIAKNTEVLKDFFRENPEIADYMARNIESLKGANDSIEKHIRQPRPKRGMTNLEIQAEQARRRIINKLQQHAHLFNLKPAIFANNYTLKILPKNLIPSNVRKLQASKHEPGFDIRKKIALDELEVLEDRLKAVSEQYLQEKRKRLQDTLIYEGLETNLERKTKAEYAKEAQANRDYNPKLIDQIIQKKQNKISESNRKTQPQKDEDLLLRAKFISELSNSEGQENNRKNIKHPSIEKIPEEISKQILEEIPEETQDIKMATWKRLRFLKEKTIQAVATVLKTHGINSILLHTEKNGELRIDARALRNLEDLHPKATKEILPLLDFVQAIERALPKGAEEETQLLASVALVAVKFSIDELKNETRDLPATSWFKRLCDSIAQFFYKGYQNTASESYTHSKTAEEEFNNLSILVGDNNLTKAPLLPGYEQAKHQLNHLNHADPKEKPKGSTPKLGK